MITPRRTRLVRVPDLHAFRDAVVTLAIRGPNLVIIPNRGAARQLGRLIQRRGGEKVSADLVIRDELYDRLHGGLRNPPRRLTPYERDVLVQAAAREHSSALRPGLVAEMLRFYDQLRRQGQQVARFEELLEEALNRDAEFDRGAARMLQQTRLLSATFRAYERRAADSGGCDEHMLRERLLADPSPSPVGGVIITVADWIADPGGLYAADFDLLTRLHGLDTIDVVATDGILASGFHQRIHDWLPGLEEMTWDGPVSVRPMLDVPAATPDRAWFSSRDREEELIGIARRLKADRREKALGGVDDPSLDRVAVVYKRPLPYLYLAPSVLGGARIPFQTSDTLPLAAEPFAAALDLVFDFVASSFTRGALIALLRSPHFSFGDKTPVDRRAISALDRALSDARYLGQLDRLSQLAVAWQADGRHRDAWPALLAAVSAAEELLPLRTPAPASLQIQRLLSFLEIHVAQADSRTLRTRTAIVDTLEALAAAARAHDDVPVEVDGLASIVRRWIEESTFAPAPSEDQGGVQLVDDHAARYGDFDEIAIVGLIEGEWPERPRRNIFYSPTLLSALGWPSEKDWRGAAEARFMDLLGSSAGRVALSTFTLDDEALVEPSPLVDEVPRAGLSTVACDPSPVERLFMEDALSLDPVALEALDPESRSWATLRAARSDDRDPSFHGQAGAQASRAWSVSALETYLECPFKFFAQRVLRLEEEPDDEEVMDPRQQGQFVHEVFEKFFRRWQADGHQAITPGQPRGRARNLRRGRGREPRRAVGHGSGARAHAAARVVGRGRSRRSGAAHGSRAAGRRRRAPARAHRLNGDFTFETSAGRDGLSLERQGGPRRSAGRRHVPADRLQARMAAQSRARAAAADLRPVRRAAPRRSPGQDVDARRSRLSGVQRDRSASCRSSRRGPRTRAARIAAAARRGGGRDRPRRLLRRDRTMCIAAKPALTRRSAGRTTSVTSEAKLPFDDDDSVVVSRQSSVASHDGTVDPRLSTDAEARTYAVNPAENVVLEASAGTGKTRVLVERYVNLLRAGVDPEHILAITFTRKAAAEMRQRIVERLKEASRTSALDAARWRDLRGRLGDIAISTIDAFCLALLREFPLEADVDPGFELADDTEVPRLVEEALDRALRICRGLARDDDDVALVFAQLGERRLRVGLAALLDRRLVAPDLLRRYLAAGPRDLTAAVACRAAAERLGQLFTGVPGGLARFLASGPLGHPQFAMLAADIENVAQPFRAAIAGLKPCATSADATSVGFDTRAEQAAFRSFIDRLRGYFLTQEGKPRGERFAGTGFKGTDCESEAAWKQHREAASTIASAIAEAIRAFRRDLNVVLSRGVWRMAAIAIAEYRRTLDARALLDFSGVLERAVDLLKQMDEFARSRYRLESRYQHVLVDEFQDTNRAQWSLVEQLVRSWGEGWGASADALAPSIFIVGDRKQSIYGFRDADVALLGEAAQFIAGIRPGSATRRALSVSFRSVPRLLAFVNDVFGATAGDNQGRPYAFTYEDLDRFPVGIDQDPIGSGDPDSAEQEIGLVVGSTARFAAEAVAEEIVRLLGHANVRDKATGIARAAQPADVAILFRSRESHREIEAALQRRGVPTYVYKGLGFFETDEIQDLVAMLRYLADPTSNLRASAFLRSRFIRLSDEAVMRLAPDLAGAVSDGPVIDAADSAFAALATEDRMVLMKTRASVKRWLALVDRITPAELLDVVLAESAYHVEIRGPRRLQARENLKKLRGLVRRIQNRGYATLARIADHLERLAVGDESNAAIDAVDAVSLMTVHAAKGLEFPIVFVVNIGRGTGGVRAPIRIAAASDGRRRWPSPISSRRRMRRPRTASARKRSGYSMSR